MPSDEMVEKAQTLDDAIDNALIAWGMGWDMDGVMACLKEAKDRAALEAAEAGAVPVAWQLRVADRTPPGEWVDVPRERAERLGKEPGMEARALYTSPPSEASRDERALLDQMGRHTNWELSHSGGWTDEPARWTLHEVTGGRNDRVWTAIGEGATPAEAIATAIRARGLG